MGKNLAGATMVINCTLFAEKFVVTHWQERFCFELNNKPGKLHSRLCKINEQLFKKEALHSSPNIDLPDSALIYIVDWGDSFTEMTWSYFIQNYPKDRSGFFAIAFDGTFGFLETHRSQPKYSEKWYIY